jgi:hypothetical protein
MASSAGFPGGLHWRDTIDAFVAKLQCQQPSVRQMVTISALAVSAVLICVAAFFLPLLWIFS